MDGRTACATLKPWATMASWHLQGGSNQKSMAWDGCRNHPRHYPFGQHEKTRAMRLWSGILAPLTRGHPLSNQYIGRKKTCVCHHPPPSSQNLSVVPFPESFHDSPVKQHAPARYRQFSSECVAPKPTRSTLEPWQECCAS